MVERVDTPDLKFGDNMSSNLISGRKPARLELEMQICKESRGINLWFVQPILDTNATENSSIGIKLKARRNFAYK